MDSTLKIRPAAPEETPTVNAFYEKCGYTGKALPADSMFIAQEGEAIVGTVRLASEEDLLVLRGMQVDGHRQREGIGYQLLAAIDRAIGSRSCFCIPYKHLEKFYEGAGFQTLPDDEAPLHLQQRAQEYRDRGMDVVIMRRL